ncbi:MAG: methyltransferase domain-containing protein [Acidimicrobiia bacterium]|nr:methyltransferase domain-containing protein [Acidimicrobiia bacterium]NNF63578.1 methyltransferase domain-containing protein [Acidimicrobiia bacterium]
MASLKVLVLRWVGRLARRLVSTRFGQALTASVSAQGLPELGEFVTDDGTRHVRFDGYRDRVVPRWRAMVESTESGPPSFDEAAASAAKRDIADVSLLLESHGASLTGLRVLEVGCHGGLHAFAMADAGAASVLAIDVPEYGVRQAVGEDGSSDRLQAQSSTLSELRRVNAAEFRRSDTVHFLDLDVVEVTEEAAYDFVFSWETFEHLIDPRGALTAMARALVVGGHAFHAYNPFFAHNGGHSLATLDFPYGHVVLSDSEFARYVEEFRPSEASRAVAFHRSSLNRMTQSQFREQAAATGFDIVEFLPWMTRKNLAAVDPQTVQRAQKLHPSVVVADLAAAEVWVLLRKRA